MQVTMSMEEYNELLNRDKELENKHQADLLYLGNKYKIELDKLRDENRKLITQNKSHVEQLNKMIEKYERMGVNVAGCGFCNSEKVLLYTADCNSIYISNDSGQYFLENSDTYDDNKIEIEYCPRCGRDLRDVKAK